MGLCRYFTLDCKEVNPSRSNTSDRKPRQIPKAAYLPGIFLRSIREARWGSRVESFLRCSWSWHFPQVASMFFQATLEAGLLRGTMSWAWPWQVMQEGAWSFPCLRATPWTLLA